MSDDTAAPLSGEPAKPPLSNSVKAAILMLVTMGLVLVAGFIFVVATVVKRSNHPTEQTGFAGRFGVTDIHVAPGDAVKSVTMADDRIAIHVGSDKNEEIIIVSPKTGLEIGRIRLRPLSDLASREIAPPQAGN
ncbi:hypothetical protein [Parvibaculum sp.]|uniref:hypothetical protein n=1 Tax=Parvibaculum sp. TaxID=2024848 RepID=UPI003210FC96